MIGNYGIISGDGHFHLYPCYDLVRAFSELIRNLDALVEFRGGNFNLAQPAGRGIPPEPADAKRPASSAESKITGSGADQEREIFRIAFLTESGEFDYFQKIAAQKSVFSSVGLEVRPGPEEHCLSFIRDGKLLLVLVAGRQIAAAERLEVLGLGMRAKIPDGVCAAEAIERTLAYGGLPVLPFSPGKWLFERAGIVRQLAEKYGRKLIIGDSALRPPGWGEPEIMRRAREINRAVLAGSDPLPLAGEEKYGGRYGFVYRGPFDSSRPFTVFKQIIADQPERIMPAGKRCAALNITGRLLRLRIFKEKRVGP